MKKNVFGFMRSGVHPDNVKAYQKILEEHEISVFGICENDRQQSMYDASIQVYSLETWLREKWTSFNVKNFQTYQEKYPEYNLWEVYYTDRYARYKYKYDDAVRIIIGMISFWEYVFERTAATHIFTDGIIGAFSFLGMIVGKKKFVPYISVQGARYKAYYSYFSLGEGYDNIEQKNMADSPLSSRDREMTEQYIKNYILNRKHPDDIFFDCSRSYDLITTLFYFVKKIKNISYIWDKRFKNKFDIILYKGIDCVLTPLKEAFRRLFIKSFFEYPDYNRDNYVLVPLQFQPEASTCVFARKYENQLFFIEQLAKSIPCGKILYVKEHYVRLGSKPISFYKELKKYPNVKLIAPDVPVHELIEKCSFIVTLTSTTGVEALMYGKPVFVLGNCFYEHFSGVKKLQDVFNEKEQFLHPPIQDRNLYIKQMAYYLKSTQLCTFLQEPLYFETPERLREIQMQSIEAVLDFAKKLKNNNTSNKSNEE